MPVSTKAYLKESFPNLLKMAFFGLLGYWVGRDSAFDAVEAVVYDKLSAVLSYVHLSVSEAGGWTMVLLALFEIFRTGGRKK